MNSKLILEGKSINSESDFHDNISYLLKLPSNYGKNLDALWDCLTGCVEKDTQILWEDHELSKSAFPEDFKKILSVFERWEQMFSGCNLTLE